MRTTALFLLVIGLSGCGMSPTRSASEYDTLRYCFIVEEPSVDFIDHMDRAPEVKCNEVLLFPVVINGVVSGRKIPYGVCAPVLYRQGDDVSKAKFEGIQKWPKPRFLVWAKGYYIREIPTQFLYGKKYRGLDCLAVRLTPLMPSTDRKRFEEAMIKVLRDRWIRVVHGGAIEEIIDPTVYLKADDLQSWLYKKDGSDRFSGEFVVWGVEGRVVESLLSENDFEVIDAYLRRTN